MTTTVTRADREAAVRMIVEDSALPLEIEEPIRAWVETGVLADQPGAREANVLAQAFANHRAASTQALREAAERLCVAVEAFARYGGDPIAMRSRMFVASDALRSALAAETSGRDGGDR